MAPRKDLAAVLLEDHAVTADVLERAWREQERSGRPLWSVLLDRGYVTDDVLFRVLRRRSGAHVVREEQLLRKLAPPGPGGNQPPRVIVPQDLAAELGVLPISVEQATDGKRVALAMVDPLLEIQKVKRALAHQGVIEIHRFLVHAAALRRCFVLHYADATPVRPADLPLSDQPTGLLTLPEHGARAAEIAAQRARLDEKTELIPGRKDRARRGSPLTAPAPVVQAVPSAGSTRNAVTQPLVPIPTPLPPPELGSATVQVDPDLVAEIEEMTRPEAPPGPKASSLPRDAIASREPPRADETTQVSRRPAPPTLPLSPASPEPKARPLSPAPSTATTLPMIPAVVDPAPPRAEAPRAESTRPEAPRAESTRPEAPRAESTRPEAARAESTRPDAPRPDAAPAEALRPEPPRHEPTRSPSPTESASHDATRPQDGAAPRRTTAPLTTMAPGTPPGTALPFVALVPILLRTIHALTRELEDCLRRPAAPRAIELLQLAEGAARHLGLSEHHEIGLLGLIYGIERLLLNEEATPAHELGWTRNLASGLGLCLHDLQAALYGPEESATPEGAAAQRRAHEIVRTAATALDLRHAGLLREAFAARLGELRVRSEVVDAVLHVLALPARPPHAVLVDLSGEVEDEIDADDEDEDVALLEIDLAELSDPGA